MRVEWLGGQMDEVQAGWRRETKVEAAERFAAEAKADPQARREQVWAQAYAPLRIAHTMVVHKRTKGRRMQFVCMRRVLLSAEDVATIRVSLTFQARNLERFGIFLYRLLGVL